MHFEEVSYRVHGRPVTLGFHPRMTVVDLAEGAQEEWVERAIGVLLGTRAGDDVALVFADSSGDRIRLERDGHGAATVTDFSTGEEVGYAAAHLPLDGRFDWFASIGIDTDSARALAILDPSVFQREEHFDPYQAEADLDQARHLLSRMEGEYQAVTARHRRAKDLRLRVADLDEQIRRLEEEAAGRRRAEAAERVRAAEARVAALSIGLGGIGRQREVVRELEVAHQAVEEAEQGLDNVKVRALAIAARRRLARACEYEQAVLARSGFASWLSFQMRRIDVLFEGDALAALRVAELESRLAQAAWRELAGEVDAELSPAGSDVLDDAPVAETGVLLDESARLLEEACRAECGLPDVDRLRDRREALQGRIAALETASRAGYKLVGCDEAEMVLVVRIAQAGRAGPWAEPIPVVIVDALAGFARHDKWSLLDFVARISETTQVVYLTSDQDTLQWAWTKAGTGSITVLRGDSEASAEVVQEMTVTDR